MVATSGRGWVLAPCLVSLIAETDRLFPKRWTTSDGSIGDAAHSARTSDHNPSSGYVRAVDVTDDDAHGCDVSVLVHHLVAKRDPRVKYLIHKGTIWKSYPNRGLTAWTPQVYTGTNAHAHHLHVSVLDGHEDDRGPWWPQATPKPPAIHEEDDDMAAQIVWYTDPQDSSKAHAYQVFGSGIGKHLIPSALKLAKGLGVKEVNAGKPFGADWRETVALLDGPCKSV